MDKEERTYDQDASDARLAKNGARFSTHWIRSYYQSGYKDHNLDNSTFVMPQSLYPPSAAKR